MTETIDADELRNRDAQAWLEVTIARLDGMPGQTKAVDAMRNELADLRRRARQRGWSTPAPTSHERMVDRARERECSADAGEASRKAVPKGQGPRERSAILQFSSTNIGC